MFHDLSIFVSNPSQKHVGLTRDWEMKTFQILTTLDSIMTCNARMNT